MDSPVGPLELAERDGVLVRLSFAGAAGDGTPVASGGGGSLACRALRAYLDGEVDAIDRVEVAYEGTPFQNEVWRRLRLIPAGETASYGGLAEALGRPGADRAVASANAANPVAIVVPCHRVIAADGSLGGYGGGAERKRWLLRHEARHRPLDWTRLGRR